MTTKSVSESMSKLSRKKNFSNKFPTIRLDIPQETEIRRNCKREGAFKLDCVAVSNISQDYCRLNPKLGSVIPPYNPMADKAISRYFENRGIYDLLLKTAQVYYMIFSSSLEVLIYKTWKLLV